MLSSVAECVGCVVGWQERLVVAREKSSLKTAQNAALCSVCRTPVRDTPAAAVNVATPPVVPARMSAPELRLFAFHSHIKI